MPNRPIPQDQLNSQNGRHRGSQILSDEAPEVTSFEQTPPLTELSETPQDDWSPLTQELVDTLPRVWTRGLLYFLVIFASVILPWAMLAKVDETGSARGRLEPKGATQRLDAPVPGTVTKVSVKEGQTINAGQVLIELESELIRNELQEVQDKIEGQKNQRSQLELIKNQLLIAIRTQEQQNQAQVLEKQAQIEQAQQNLAALKKSYNLQKEEKLAQVNQARQDLEQNKNNSEFAARRVISERQKVERYKRVFEEGVISKDRFAEAQQSADDSLQAQEKTASDIKQAQLRLAEQRGNYQTTIHQAQAEIEQAESRLKEQQSGYQSLIQSGKLAILKSQEQLKNLEAQITALQAEMSQSESQIQSLKFQLNQRILRAPIAGTIFRLPVEKAGTVVEPGQTIAQIAPKDAILVFKANISTSESGFLKEGMPVKLKFDAYPFQDYGVIQGHLRWISPDSKMTETAQGQMETFELEIAIDQPYIQNQNKRIALTPGQTATAEVVVRQRRVIDFILDPFKKLQKGGLEL